MQRDERAANRLCFLIVERRVLCNDDIKLMAAGVQKNVPTGWAPCEICEQRSEY